MKKGLLNFTMILLAISFLIKCDSKTNKYPKELIQGIMNYCQQTKAGNQKECNCLLNKIQDKYTYEEYSSIEANIKVDEPLPLEFVFFLEKTAKSCIKNFNGINSNNLDYETEEVFSTETIKAFFMLEEGIHRNNVIVEHGTYVVIYHMEETSNTVTQHKPLADKAKEVSKLTENFLNYIDELRKRIVKESGGGYTREFAESIGYPELEGRPTITKNKDTPHRIFISGDYDKKGKKEPQGPILEKKILELKYQYLDLVSALWEGKGIPNTIFTDPSKKEASMKELENVMTLTSSENYYPKHHYNKTWASYTFGNLSVVAIYPMLRKFQNDAITSEAAVINFLALQMRKLE